MIHRRDVLRASAAAVAGMALPAAADQGAAADLRRLVDRLADRSRVTRPFLLRRFDAARLNARERVLYETLLPGADADAALAQRAWGKNGAPYPVTHRNGNWRRAAELREEDPIRNAVRTVNQDTNAIEASARRGVVAPGFVIDATLPELRNAAQRVQSPRNSADSFIRPSLPEVWGCGRAGSTDGVPRRGNASIYGLSVPRTTLGER